MGYMKIVAMILASVAVAAASDVTGSWTLTVKAPDGQQINAELALKKEAGAFTGTIQSAGRTFDLREIKLEGDNLSFQLTVREQPYTLKLAISGDSLKGTYSTADGSSGPVSATRVPSAGAGVEGKWKVVAKGSQGQYDLELVLTQAGGKLRGTLATPEGTVTIEDTHLAGKELSFKLPMSQGVYVVNMTVAGGSMDGTYVSPSGDKGTITASR